MNKNILSKLISTLALGALVWSCTKKNETPTPSFRSNMGYPSTLDTAQYATAFKDGNGVSTVDLSEGNNLLRMFNTLNNYASTAIANNQSISSVTLNNLFSNSGSPFYDLVTTIGTFSGSNLNNQPYSISSRVATSGISDNQIVINKFKIDFDSLAASSAFVTSTASSGKAGKLGTYLVNKKGIEYIQVIQKGLIGALQLDYIGNVLLNTGLQANNSQLVSGKLYTELEQNWDKAYGLLTLNQVFLKGATDAVRSSPEFALGAYVWEYNKSNYAKIHPAYTKGRAAIVNGDLGEAKVQADFIRKQMEYAIANSALGYMNKWKTGTTDAVRAHAFAEGLGFIYALRFCKIYGADAAYSDAIINGLLSGQNGFWDLDNAKINSAISAISSKFSL